MRLDSFYFGTIDEVYPPSHPRNGSGYQYEYKVIITGDDYAQIPCKAIRMDPFGSFHNFEDAILAVGYRVFVIFPKGDPSLGVIMGGSRLYGTEQDESEGYHYRHRFNEIETFIDNKGTWSVDSDDGPGISLSKQIITLDDSEGDQIILDKATKTVTINCTEWKVTIAGNANITVAKDANISVQGKATAKVTGDLSVECANANVKAKEVKVDASGDVSVKGKTIKLGSGMGNVLTSMSDPILCPITGLPAVGVPTVKAG